VAEEARSKGIAYRPEVKRQMDLVRAIVIAQTYAQPAPGGVPAAPAAPPAAAPAAKEGEKPEGGDDASARFSLLELD